MAVPRLLFALLAAAAALHVVACDERPIGIGVGLGGADGGTTAGTGGAAGDAGHEAGDGGQETGDGGQEAGDADVDGG